MPESIDTPVPSSNVSVGVPSSVQVSTDTFLSSIEPSREPIAPSSAGVAVICNGEQVGMEAPGGPDVAG